MIQRLKDALHERRIKRATAQAHAAYVAGDRAAARAMWHELAPLIAARSPEQVARMEARLHRGHPIKSAIGTAYGWHILPARVVTWLFRVFNLGAK